MNLDPLQTLVTPHHWPTFALVATRLTGLMFTAPLWSMAMLPRALRAALVVLLSAMLLPAAVGNAVAPSEHLAGLPLPFATEMAIGLVIGLVGAVLVQGVALAGEVMSLQTGLSLAPSLAPLPDLQESGIGQLATLLGLFVYVGVGGHLTLLRALGDSFQALPAGGLPDLAEGGRHAAAVAGRLFGCALAAAAPVMVALLLTNLAIALLARAVPQMNGMLVSFPITISVGLAAFGAALPVIASAVARWLGGLSAETAAMVQALTPGH